MLLLNVLTMNVWGIPFVSSDREVRIEAIAAELSTGRYDIVSLQEVWSQADYETLKQQAEAALPYSHYFYSGVMGAGLLVLSKYPIIGALFHPWTVNGYFHRIQHADWFGGKGVGLCRILVDGQVVHLYNAHLHAEYDNENDEYKTHRVIQAFDTAQFIEATRGNAVLQILAGDLNTQPQDISYKILLYTSKMLDACTTNTEIATNECDRNSYTKKRALVKNPLGIRIDHIFVRSAEQRKAHILEYSLPLPERVPGYRFSFSDHEAVLVKLKLSTRRTPPDEEDDTCAADDDEGATAQEHCFKPNGVLKNVDPAAATCAATDASALRIASLHEAVALCDAALQQLKVDRILYFSVAVFLGFFLIALAEYGVPGGFKTLYLLLKFLLFGVILYSLFMGSIWNFMERHGVLSGKLAMEIMLVTNENSHGN